MDKNKYEDIEILDLEDKIMDIVDIYIEHLYNTHKTVGIIVNKDLAEYVMYSLLPLEEISIKEVDLVSYYNVMEYLVSVDNDGYMSVTPIEDYHLLDDTDIFYIDMDGDIPQDIIDYCVDEDKEVILFGQYDEDYEDCKNCKCANSHTDDEDTDMHGFTVSKNIGDAYATYSFYSTEKISNDEMEKLLKSFGL